MEGKVAIVLNALGDIDSLAETLGVKPEDLLDLVHKFNNEHKEEKVLRSNIVWTDQKRERGMLGEVYLQGYRIPFSLPATLYYLRINGGQAYKIGVTSRSVQERFSNGELEKIKVIKTWDYAIGMDARKAELYIIRKYKHSNWKGEDLLQTGNTELFDHDVLDLDRGGTAKYLNKQKEKKI